MIKQKKKICKECNTEQYIFSKGLCKKCAAKSYKKPKQVSSKQQEKLDKNKIDTELMKKCFQLFYKNHPTKCCEQCDKKITELRTYNVHHLLEKRNYLEYKFDLNNFMLLCADCHSTYESIMKGDKIIEQLNEIKEKYNL